MSTVEVVAILWQERLKLLLFGVSFAGLGIIAALLMTPVFISEARLMPEGAGNSGSALNRLASVAGFAGVDITDEDMDAIRPELYPNVLQSTPFALSLAHQSVPGAHGSTQPLEQLLRTESPVGLVRRWLAWATPESRPLPVVSVAGTLQLSVQEHELVDEINERVRAAFDSRSGIITITAQMPDPVVAAAVAQLAMNHLTRYVSNYRTQKARQDLGFYKQQLDDARRRYHSAQAVLFRYNEQHRHVILLSTTMDRQRMEAELSIAQTVYTELSAQYEQAKLKVQVRTPVFTVLEPPSVPIRRVSPRRTLVVLVTIVAGLGLGCVYVLLQAAATTGWLPAFFTTQPNDRIPDQTQQH